MARKRTDVFTRFTTTVSEALGRPWVFVVALAVLLLWAVSGPLLGFSDTWQLLINTSTTIVTFLMVFIIQNTQNRDQIAVNVKLDAIMRKLDIKTERLLSVEDESDTQLERDKKKIEHPKHSKHTGRGNKQSAKKARR